MHDSGSDVVCVRALLHCQDHVALIERITPCEQKPFYVLPGGHVELNETLPLALERECLEELGLVVTVGTYFTQGFHTEPDGTRRVEHYYFVRLRHAVINLPTFRSQVEHHPAQKGTYTPRWINCNQLTSLDLRPADVWKRLFHPL